MNSLSAAPRPHSASFWKLTNDFFFAQEVPYGMALVRMTLPVVLLVDVVRRWPFARELYSRDGATAPLAFNFGYPGFLPEMPGSVAVGLYTLLTLFLVTSAIGWCTRLSLSMTTGLYYYFNMLDCLSTMSKYTVIAAHLLLLMAVSRCGDVWSVDAWLVRRRARKETPPAPLPDVRSAIWPQRLVQILFGMIYFGAAVTKMHTPEFFSGDQLVYWMMTYINNEHPLGDYLSQYPLFVSVSCFITFLWELMFIFTVWDRRIRWYVLGIGTVFHIMTVFTLGLIVFPIVIIASYFVFLDEASVRTILNWRPMRRFAAALLPAQSDSVDSRPLPAPNGRFGTTGAFALVAILVSLAGIETEYLLDHYKMRSPGGPLPLRELSDQEVQQLFAPDRRMRQCDKLLAFDLGTTLIGEHLASYRNQFRQGEQLVAQVTLNPPHEDMWIDCVLCEATVDETDESERLLPGRLLTKVGQPVLHEASRCNFFFRLDESMEPGDYFLKLRSGNEEVSRRHFKVLPRIAAASN